MTAINRACIAGLGIWSRGIARVTARANPAAPHLLALRRTAIGTPRTAPIAPPTAVAASDTARLPALAGIVTSTAARIARASDCHDRASTRLDAAAYELFQLRQDMASLRARHPAMLDRR